MKRDDNPSTEKALDRLLLCNRVRELAIYRRPVTLADLGLLYGLFSVFVWFFYGVECITSRFNSIRFVKRIILYLLALVFMRILLLFSIPFRFRKKNRSNASTSKLKYSFSIKRDIDGILRIFYRRVHYGLTSSLGISHYVKHMDKDVPLIRTAVLLRIMGDFGTSAELLIKRYCSGSAGPQTLKWLFFFLMEAGDPDTAASIYAPEPMSDTKPEKKKTKLKYGLVMPTMFDSEIFRSSILSVINSDFSGEIVVVEDGHVKERLCEGFCKDLPVKYVKNPIWTGSSGVANLGIKQLPIDTDIIIYTHSDVLWPPNWHADLDLAWEQVYASGRVGRINFGYLQCKSNLDASLYDLFISGKYEDLTWVLSTMKDVPGQAEKILDIQIKNRGQMFGLAIDSWNYDFTRLKIQMGRFSVGASFPMKAWCDIGGFDPDMSVAMDLELQYHDMKKHQLNLWLNNRPLVHFLSVDTTMLSASDNEKFMKSVLKTYELFQKKYGFGIEQFLSSYFGETSVIYFDEIVKAANEMRFKDVDFIFDDFFERLKR
ncbi:MAG: glycosyltransferase family A protein [Candidatus Saganbacteria bacterium]|nr:glycosyltransferase family A protein [Candidatus Saganbacteria bacterium]